jgi:hypothetical protein
MNLKYKILAVLAAGIALTACGSSGVPASTPHPVQCRPPPMWLRKV